MELALCLPGRSAPGRCPHEEVTPRYFLGTSGLRGTRLFVTPHDFIGRLEARDDVRGGGVGVRGWPGRAAPHRGKRDFFGGIG